MELKVEQDSDLRRLVDAITNVEGVVAIVLFGSRAKGDFDEYSDYDLLVVFEDDEVMWSNRRNLFENTGKLGLFAQVLTRSVRELWEKTETTFLQSILEHGIILYLRYPLKAPAFLQNLRPMAIVTYELKGLSQNEKMRLIYRLFGKQTVRGIVYQKGGKKLGDGCFMIPMENLEETIRFLKQNDVEFDVTRFYKPIGMTEKTRI